MTPEIAVGGIAIHDGRLLLIQRGTEPGKGKWSLPGGRVQMGETLVEAVVRELYEETGLAGVCGRFVGWVERVTADHHFVIMDFAVDLFDDHPAPVAGDDAADVEFVPIELVCERPLVDGLAEFLADHHVIDVFT